jgi:Cu(I)/Ag(I) efflux system protein CusF
MKSVYLLPIVLLCTLPALCFADAMDMKGMKMSGSDMKGMMQPAKSQMTYKGVGIVKNIDSAQSTVTLSHEPIADLHWPAMTMGFGVKDKSLLKTLVVGQKVNFELIKEGSDYVFVSAK